MAVAGMTLSAPFRHCRRPSWRQSFRQRRRPVAASKDSAVPTDIQSSFPRPARKSPITAKRGKYSVVGTRSSEQRRRHTTAGQLFWGITYPTRQRGMLLAPLSAGTGQSIGAARAVDRGPCDAAWQTKEHGNMIKLAIIFFIISLVAGLLGFTNIAAGAAGIAKILFFIALTIFLIVLIFGVMLGLLVF